MERRKKTSASRTREGFLTRLKSLSNLGLALIIILLIVSLTRNIIKTLNAKRIIDERKEKVEKLEEENKKLEERLSEVTGDEFIEVQLRDKLGLAKEGEVIVVLPDEEILKRLIPEREREEDKLPDPNWKKWLRLFF